MSKSTKTTNWGIVGWISASGGLGLNAAGTIYMLHNFGNGERFLFLLADIGLGGAFGLKSEGIHTLVKKILSSVSVYDTTSISKITANREFSAEDLHLASGAEATVGATALAGYSATTISAWPFLSTGTPDSRPVNNDYFSGVDVSGWQAGLGAGAAYRFYGLWVKLWSFQ